VDFSRVPFPAARMTTARSLAGIIPIILREQNQFRNAWIRRIFSECLIGGGNGGKSS
jgi:hypothetical protein